MMDPLNADASEKIRDEGETRLGVGVNDLLDRCWSCECPLCCLEQTAAAL